MAHVVLSQVSQISVICLFLITTTQGGRTRPLVYTRVSRDAIKDDLKDPNFYTRVTRSSSGETWTKGKDDENPYRFTRVARSSPLDYNEVEDYPELDSMSLEEIRMLCFNTQDKGVNDQASFQPKNYGSLDQYSGPNVKLRTGLSALRRLLCSNLNRAPPRAADRLLSNWNMVHNQEMDKRTERQTKSGKNGTPFLILRKYAK